MTRNEIFQLITEAQENGIPGKGRVAYAMIVPKPTTTIPPAKNVKETIGTKSGIFEFSGCYAISLVGATYDHIEYFINKALDESGISNAHGVLFC